MRRQASALRPAMRATGSCVLFFCLLAQALDVTAPGGLKKRRPPGSPSAHYQLPAGRNRKAKKAR